MSAATKLDSKRDPLRDDANQLARSAEVTDIGLRSDKAALRNDLSSDHPERLIVWIAAFFLLEVAIGLWWWLS